MESLEKLRCHRPHSDWGGITKKRPGARLPVLSSIPSPPQRAVGDADYGFMQSQLAYASMIACAAAINCSAVAAGISFLADGLCPFGCW